MAIRKTKPDRVEVNAGATVTVIVNGEPKYFSCSGSNEGGRDLTPEQVVKNLANCIKQAAKGKGRQTLRRK
jgi:transcriptional regulator of nitric oxide reductase